MREGLKKAAELFQKYAVIGESTTTAEKSAQYIKDLIPDEIKKWGINESVYKVKGSVGEGRTAETPWITVMRKSITTSVQRGVFVIYIYSADLKKIYLGLMLGCAYFEGSGRNQKERIRTLANAFAQVLEIPKGFIKDSMPLGGDAERTKKYSLASICYKEYDVLNLPSDSVLEKDFLKIMDVYELFVSLKGKRTIDQVFAYYEHNGDALIENQAIVTSEDCPGDVPVVIDMPEEKQEPIYDRKGRKHYPRDQKRKENALKLAEFKCEFDNQHFIFWTRRNSRMYVEAHHLIPLSLSEMFSVSLDVEANIVSLCPNCHRCFHYAAKDMKKQMIQLMNQKRKERLEKSGIMITEDIVDQILK